MYVYEYWRDIWDCIYLEHRPSLMSKKHFHNCMEFVYVVKGHTTVHIDDEPYEAGPGQMIACTCFSRHYYSNVADGDYIVMVIPRKYFREYDSLFNSLGLKSPIVTDTSDKSILSLVNMLAKCVQKTNNFTQPVDNTQNSFANDAMYFISALLVNTCIQTCGIKSRVRLSSLVADAVCIIEDDFRGPLTVADVCKKTGYNQKDLTYQFNKTMNMSILDYIHRTRILEAARLLTQQPNLPIGSVMFKSGFRSNRTFLRNFEKIFGCSPSEYRQNHATQTPEIEI